MGAPSLDEDGGIAGGGEKVRKLRWQRFLLEFYMQNMWKAADDVYSVVSSSGAP